MKATAKAAAHRTPKSPGMAPASMKRSVKQPLPGKHPAAAKTQSKAAGRKAKAVDPEIKSATLRRLTRIEGQVRGLQKMVKSERYCADILVQISSVHQALRGVSQQLMRNHLRHCATAAIRKNATTADSMYDELLDLIYRHAR